MKSAKAVVIDSNVVIDAIDFASDNHTHSLHFLRRASEAGIELLLPMHGFFEMSCAIRRSRTLNSNGLHPAFSEADGLRVTPIPIDEKFMEQHMDCALPALRAGDFIYLAVASRRHVPLVTNDKPFHKEAKAHYPMVYFPIDALVALGLQ